MRKFNKVLFLVILFGFYTNCYSNENIKNISNSSNIEITKKDVESFIINMSSDSNNILNNENIADIDKEKKYKDFTADIVDSNWVARFILGSNWRELNNNQKQEFQELYKEYLLENYMPKLKDYNKELSVVKIEKIKEKVFLAYTKTEDKDGRIINVNFRIIEKNNKLYITDIIAEGISFISSQRTDINNSISQNGYDNFIKDLKSKIKNK